MLLTTLIAFNLVKTYKVIGSLFLLFCIGFWWYIIKGVNK